MSGTILLAAHESYSEPTAGLRKLNVCTHPFRAVDRSSKHTGAGRLSFYTARSLELDLAGWLRS